MSEEKLKNLAKKLKPNKNDKQQYGAAIKAASEVLRKDKNILVAEVWKCGSIGKKTGVRTKSDIDMVILLSPKQNMGNIFDLFKNALKGCSSEPVETSKRAVQVKIHGIEMDILPTKYGIQNHLGRAQNDGKLVSEIVQLGQLFSDTTRILKYWRDYPDNAPKKDNIPSFAIEIIVAHVMKNNDFKTHAEIIMEFFEYIRKSQLIDPLTLHDKDNNIILSYNFEFKKKENLINQASYSLKLLKKNDLKFIGL